MAQHKRPKKQVKGTRDWKRYNGWRKHDFELMVRHLRREVEELPSPFRRRRKRGDYTGRKRGRKPADHVSVLMALALKIILESSYRGLYARLETDWSLRDLAGIHRLPHYNTLHAYMSRLPTGYLDELIRRTYLRGEERKKSRADPGAGGPLMAPASGPTGGPRGSPSDYASASHGGSS